MLYSASQAHLEPYTAKTSSYFPFLSLPLSLCRQNTVEDLVKLARQFDKNMQDRESSERAPNNDFNNSSSRRGNTCKAKLGSAAKMKDLQCSSSSDGVEAELQALFDCSTQRVSGRLSQGSSVSSSSQDVKDQPAAALLERSRQTGLPSGKSAPAAGLKATASRSNDFDDDWENDELLSDPLLLEITHNPPQVHDRPETTSQTNGKRGTDQSCSGVQSAKTTSARQPSAARSKLTCSTLQDLCPKLKTTNRSTFKLEPNLRFQAEDLSRPALTPPQPKPQTSPVTSTTTKTHQPVQSTSSSTGAAGCSQGVSDSLWDDGDDDTLLYQVCDSVERISNTQLDQGGSSCTNRRPVGDRAQTCTAPVHIEAGATSRAQRESPRTFVRSNSLPATGSQAGNYRGWDVPLKGANKKPHMSQSLPGSHMALGTSQPRDCSGKFQNDGNDGTTKACLVTTRTSHTVFKRNFSDSAVPSNKGTIQSLKWSILTENSLYFNCMELKISQQMLLRLWLLFLS